MKKRALRMILTFVFLVIIDLIITKCCGTELVFSNPYHNSKSISWEETFEVFPRMLLFAAILSVFSEYIIYLNFKDKE